MPRIACPECGHQVSDLAKTCPECGHPMGGRVRTTEDSALTRNRGCADLLIGAVALPLILLLIYAAAGNL